MYNVYELYLLSDNNLKDFILSIKSYPTLFFFFSYTMHLKTYTVFGFYYYYTISKVLFSIGKV